MDDDIHGAVLLVNDSESLATVSKVETSCGCTAAIPIKKTVEAGKKNILVFHFSPKSVGETKIEAAFTFGGNDFLMKGVAKTKSRFQQSTAALTFEGNEAEFVLTKNVPTKVDRFELFTPNLKVREFKDSPNTMRAILVRSDRMPSDVIFSPAFGAKIYKQMRFELKYAGVVDVLPRRLIARQKNLRFFLRGDVASLAGSEKMMIDTRQVDCKTSLQGNVLKVEFENIFEPGEHRPIARINETSFPLPVSAR